MHLSGLATPSLWATAGRDKLTVVGTVIPLVALLRLLASFEEV